MFAIVKLIPYRVMNLWFNIIGYIINILGFIVSGIGLYVDNPKLTQLEKRTEVTVISVIILIVNVGTLLFRIWCQVNHLI